VWQWYLFGCRVDGVQGVPGGIVLRLGGIELADGVHRWTVFVVDWFFSVFGMSCWLVLHDHHSIGVCTWEVLVGWVDCLLAV